LNIGGGVAKVVALLIIAVIIGALAPTIFSTLGLVNMTGWSPIAVTLFYVVNVAVALGLVIVVLEVVGIKVTGA
jgi:hypothetical protein